MVYSIDLIFGDVEIILKNIQFNLTSDKVFEMARNKAIIGFYMYPSNTEN
jgi:hypothetical protein